MQKNLFNPLVSSSFQKLKQMFVILTLVGLSTGCHKKNEHEATVEEGQRKLIRITDIGKDFFVPSAIWDDLSGAQLKRQQESGTVAFLPLSVTFREKNPGVLTHPEIQFEFAKGGGDLDLASVVSGKTGTFFLNFGFQGFSEPENLQIFFVSTVKKTKVSGVIKGEGCDRAYNIREFAISRQKTGIEVNTYSDNHLFLLGGHFIFATKVKSQALVTQVSVFDSSKPYLFCENLLLKKRTRENLSAGA